MTARTFEEWEAPLKVLEEGLTTLRDRIDKEKDPVKRDELTKTVEELELRKMKFLKVQYGQLGPWEKVLVSRAAARPYTLDYIGAIFTNFLELQGDRRFGADHALIGGIAAIDGRPVVVCGQQKGRNIPERQLRNFGYARPEGYRKAIRLFEMAERFRMPVITFVDTPGADAGVEAESRGISEAIAACMMQMFELTVPSLSVIIGEGGSGGAIGIACSNKVYMLEHSIYSVIAPEGCAAILWRKAEMAPQAAQALKLTAESAQEFGLIDGIINEPLGGAHRDPLLAATNVKTALLQGLDELDALSPQGLREARYNRFRELGVTA